MRLWSLPSITELLATLPDLAHSSLGLIRFVGSKFRCVAP